MSRIGKLPIQIPDKVDVKIDGQKLIVKGPLGQLEQEFRPEVTFELEGKTLLCQKASEEPGSGAFWGLYRALANNMVVGVSTGYERHLDVIGVGYKIEQKDPRSITLNVGYSNPVEFKLPDGIKGDVDPKANHIKLSGADKQLLGQVAANLRKVRPPEPYKGKGIKYTEEIIRRKAGKAGAKK